MSDTEIITLLLDRQTQTARINEGTAAERIIVINPMHPPLEFVVVTGRWEAHELTFESVPRGKR